MLTVSNHTVFVDGKKEVFLKTYDPSGNLYFFPAASHQCVVYASPAQDDDAFDCVIGRASDGSDVFVVEAGPDYASDDLSMEEVICMLTRRMQTSLVAFLASPGMNF